MQEKNKKIEQYKNKCSIFVAERNTIKNSIQTIKRKPDDF